MSWFASLAIGFLTAVACALGAIGLGVLCVEWFRVSSREGASGYFVIFLGLIGLVVGGILGVVCARIVAAGAAPGFLRGLGVALGSGVGLLALITLCCRLAADLPTTVRGRAVVLHAELRCPVGFELPAAATGETWYAHIDTRSRRHTARTDLPLTEATLVDGRRVIPFSLELNTSVREKLLYVILGGNQQLFIPVFPATPGKKYFEWSNWLEGGWAVGAARPTPEQAFRLRYRLELAPEKAPEPAMSSGPSEAELQAEAEVRENAALEALAPDSPLEECLRFTHYTQSEERRQRAGAVIGRRPGVVAELSAEILSSDPEVADRALRAMAFIKPLPPELAGPVAVFGEKVVVSLEQFNATKPADDPSYQGAADASLLFSSWFQGLHALHDFAGVDGLPQLKRVLDLSRQRPDSQVLKGDVERVAQYYVTEWSPVPAGK